jgi:hypothetical protein
MNRQEKLELLIKIDEAVRYFDSKIWVTKWSNEFGAGLENRDIYEKNTNDIHTFKMCINRINDRFSKQLLTLK